MAAQLLLVDDEPGLREAVQAYLEDSGFKVQVASNAREAWDILQKNSPDLVISDVMMPQVNGYQFLQELREDARFKALPVVFLTARGMKSIVSKAIKLVAMLISLNLLIQMSWWQL